MKEFKFKIWDKTNKSFLCCSNDDDLFISIQGDIYLARETLRDAYDLDYLSSSFYEISQFTGLKDCKGREIFEGDIIRLPNGEVYEVVFWSGVFCYANFNKPICNVNEVCEVIGNIYENSELLGGKNE